MSIRITHKRKGKSEARLLVDNMIAMKMDKIKFHDIGKQTAEHMVNLIDQNSKQEASPKGLRKTIKYEKITDNSWGIGRISLLPAWWAIINYGGNYIINAKNKILKFVAKDGKTIYRKSVNHIVSGINYIERTINFLTMKLSMFKMGKK